MTRPVSVVRFEWIYLAGLAAGLVNSLMTWDELLRMMSASGVDPATGSSVVAVMLVVTNGVALLLWYLAARRASNVARILLALFAAAGIFSLGWAILTTGYALSPAGAIGLVSLALQVVATAMLFSGDARRWFVRDEVA